MGLLTDQSPFTLHPSLFTLHHLKLNTFHYSPFTLHHSKWLKPAEPLVFLIKYKQLKYKE